MDVTFDFSHVSVADEPTNEKADREKSIDQEVAQGMIWCTEHSHYAWKVRIRGALTIFDFNFQK